MHQVEIDSPIVPGKKATRIYSIERSRLIQAYKDQFDRDVAPFIPEHFWDNSAGIYECKVTGYRFFYPYSVEGSGEFYDMITADKDYYNNERWEWDQLVGEIHTGEKLLEVGAGGLAFMLRMVDKGVKAEGLEINPRSLEKARKLDLRVFPLYLQDYSKHHLNEYDVVCSLHVLEHISAVRDFIDHCCRVLKPGGRLVIAVPDNDSFLKLDPYLASNLPPHHMGQWTERSLVALSAIFPLQVSRVFRQPYDMKYSLWHYQCWYRHLSYKFGILGKLFGRIMKSWYLSSIRKNQASLRGPAIIVEYKKI